ncbi:MAG: hypothetical protein ABIB79_03010 [archaeon]
MTISSKEVIILVIGLIGAVLLAIILKLQPFDFNRLQISDLLLIFFVSIISIIIIVYLKINEINKELDDQKLNQTKLNEKLKIHEQLIDIKAEIKQLKEVKK